MSGAAIAKIITEAVGLTGAGLKHYASGFQNTIRNTSPGASTSYFQLNPMSGYISGNNPTSVDTYALDPYVEWTTPRWARRMMVAGDMLSSFGSAGSQLAGTFEKKEPERMGGVTYQPGRYGKGKVLSAEEMEAIGEIEKAPGYFEWQGRKGIYIKPSKRGTFTAWCKRHGHGGVTSSCIAAGKRAGTAIKKKAVFAQNARKWKKGEFGLIIPSEILAPSLFVKMKKGGVVATEPVTGPSHDGGGVKQIINGLPVELEGGELKVFKEDGTVVVLNADQQTRWIQGTPLEEIEKELPLYDQNAQAGTEIPMISLDDDYLRNAWIRPVGMEYLTKDVAALTPFERPSTAPYFVEEPAWKPMDTTLKFSKGISEGVTGMEHLTKDLPKLTKRKFTGAPWATRSFYIPGIKEGITPPVKPEKSVSYQEPSTKNENAISTDEFFGRYKKNLKSAAIQEGLISLSNIIDAAMAYSTQPRPRNISSGMATMPGFISPPLTSPVPYLEALKQSAATMTTAAREMGRPELIDRIGADLSKGVTQIGQQVPAANIEAFGRATSDFTNRFLGAQQINLGERRFAKTLRAREEELATNAQLMNKQAIYAGLQRIPQITSQYGTNMLSADIVKYMLDTEDERMLKQMIMYNLYGQMV